MAIKLNIQMFAGEEGYGVEPDQVRNILSALNSGFDTIQDALGNVMQSQVVDTIAPNWQSPNAKQFMLAVEQEYNDLNDALTKSYNSVNESANSAASNLASMAGASFANQAFTTTRLKFDTGIIKEQTPEGGVWISQDCEGKIRGGLNQVRQMVESSTDNIKNSLLGNPRAFSDVGSNQMQNMLGSVDSINSNVKNATVALDEALSKNVKETEEAMARQTAANASAFAGE